MTSTQFLSKSEESEVWKSARRHKDLIGYIPSFVSATIRGIQNKCWDAPLDKGSRHSMGRLIKSQGVKAPIYFLAKTVRPEALENKEYISNKDLLEMFSPKELAAAMALIFLYRKLGSRCPKEEWGRFSRILQQHVDIGATVGTCIPRIGLTTGLIASSIRYFSMATYLIRDAKKFIDYRREITKAKVPYLYERELKDWNCSHMHIASLLIQSVGFGKDLANSYFSGVSGISEELLTDLGLDFRVASAWIDALHFGGELFEIGRETEYVVEGDKEEVLIQECNSIASDGSRYSWLSRTGKDISPGEVPQLWQGDQTEIIETEEDILSVQEELAETSEISSNDPPTESETEEVEA